MNTAHPAESASLQHATSVRHRVLLVTCLTAVLLYLDRFCMNFAQRYVKEDLGLIDLQVEYCMSAFFLTYALAQVPSGGLTDRFGPRWMLTWYVLAWSLFTAAMGWVGGFVGLMLVRMAAGLFGQVDLVRTQVLGVVEDDDCRAQRPFAGNERDA